MSVAEYVFINRITDFYKRMRAGEFPEKLDEIFYFLDEKSKVMTKKWLMDDRFEWTIGKGWSLLTQTPPIVAQTMDVESDRQQVLGNYMGQDTSYDAKGIETAHYDLHGRIKTARFNFFLVAPNSDMITAMYLVLQRALAEGETPTSNEPYIVPYEEMGITDLSYSGGDLRPDQNFLPNVAFARTLSVTCSYIHQWRGSSFGKYGFASSIELGNVKT